MPTQFVLEGDTVRLHLVRANPLFAALAENPRVVLSVAGDWAFIPSAWKAIGDEDPALGIPTTYYAAVQLTGTATVHDERTEPGGVAAVLRRQLATFQPDVAVADPAVAHAAEAAGHPRHQHRRRRGARPSSSTAATSTSRTGWPWWSASTTRGPGDAAAAAHLRRRLAAP